MKQKNNVGQSTLPALGGFAIFAAVVIVIVALLGLLTGSLRKAPADKIALSYGGGLFEGAQYQKTVNPGSSLVVNGLFDKWYEYPTTQRNYVINLEGDGEEKAGAINASDKNGVSQTVELTVTFKLNTSNIRQFHEVIGLKYKAYESAGWNQMLTENFRPSINNAVQQKIRTFTTDEIRTSNDVIPELQKELQSTLKAAVNKQLGAEYFCGPSYKLNSKHCPDFEIAIKAITPPASIVSSYTDQKTSENKIIVEKNNADARVEKARGEAASKDAVAPALTPEYLAYLKTLALQECAKNAGCTLVVGGNDFNVNVGK